MPAYLLLIQAYVVDCDLKYKHGHGDYSRANTGKDLTTRMASAVQRLMGSYTDRNPGVWPRSSDSTMHSKAMIR